MSEKDVESICPQPEDLTVGGVVVCTAEGCGHEFQSSSHLHMHKARHHSGKPMEKASGGKIQQFYCPVEECKRSVGKGRPFPRMGQLKQHFQTIHGSKDFVCHHCGKRFGLRDVCKRHEAECGQIFTCATCGEGFHSKNALYQHAKRKKHILPDGSHPTRSKPTSSSRPHPYQLPPIIVQPVIMRPVVNNKTTQTDIQPQSQDVAIQTQVIPRLSAGIVQCSIGTSSAYDLTTTSPASSILDLATQTQADLATQTDFSDLIGQFLNFGTQTAIATATQECQTHLTNSSEFGTQTSEDPSLHDASMCSAVEFGTQTFEDSDAAIHQFQSSAVEFGTQTFEDCDAAIHQLHSSAVEFGTQTFEDSDAAIHQLHSSAVEFGTQTFEDSDAAIHQLHSSAVEFGTQTFDAAIHQFQSSAVEFGTQTFEDSDAAIHQLQSSAVEFGTQTFDSSMQYFGSGICSAVGTQTVAACPPSLRECEFLFDDNYTFCRNLLPPDCMEFGTQTLESCLDDIHSLDFGVQTLLQTETREQGSQT